MARFFKSSTRRSPIGHVLYFAALLGSGYSAAVLFGYYVGTWTTSFGPSMYPTMQSGATATIYSRLNRRGKDLKVGDIIHADNPFFQHKPVGKRIIGMPGDYVLRDPSLAPTPGGAPLPGIVEDDGKREEPMMIRVPEGHVWLAGDNMSWSRDSRFYGPVPMASIIGKTLYNGDGWFSWNSFRGDQLKPVQRRDEDGGITGDTTDSS